MTSKEHIQGSLRRAEGGLFSALIMTNPKGKAALDGTAFDVAERVG
jgi:hypothetical protein